MATAAEARAYLTERFSGLGNNETLLERLVELETQQEGLGVAALAKAATVEFSTAANFEAAGFYDFQSTSVSVTAAQKYDGKGDDARQYDSAINDLIGDRFDKMQAEHWAIKGITTANASASPTPPRATNSARANSGNIEIGEPINIAMDNTTIERRGFILGTIEAARNVESETGVPWMAMVLQAAHESGFNLNADTVFGVKAQGQKLPEGATIVTKSTWEEINGETVHIKADFVKLKSFEQAFDYQGEFLSGDRYKNALQFAGEDGNIVFYLEEVREAGYATDSRYIDKLIDLGQDYHHFMRDLDNIYRDYDKLSVAGKSASYTSPSYIAFAQTVTDFREQYGVAGALETMVPNAALAAIAEIGRGDTNLGLAVNQSVAMRPTFENVKVRIDGDSARTMRDLVDRVYKPWMDKTDMKTDQHPNFPDQMVYTEALNTINPYQGSKWSTEQPFGQERNSAMSRSDRKDLRAMIKRGEEGALTAGELESFVSQMKTFAANIDSSRWHSGERDHIAEKLTAIDSSNPIHNLQDAGIEVAQALATAGAEIGECPAGQNKMVYSANSSAANPTELQQIIDAEISTEIAFLVRNFSATPAQRDEKIQTLLESSGRFEFSECTTPQGSTYVEVSIKDEASPTLPFM